MDAVVQTILNTLIRDESVVFVSPDPALVESIFHRVSEELHDTPVQRPSSCLLILPNHTRFTALVCKSP